MKKSAVVVFLSSLFVIGCAGPPRSSAPAPARWTNSIGLEFALIPAGTFTMGTNSSGEDTRAHQVTLTRPYYLSRLRVTKRMFKLFRTETGVDYPELGLDPQERDRAWDDRGADSRPRTDFSYFIWSSDEDASVTRVSWTVADQFCAWLSKKEGVTYRLPTEAEWERADLGGAEEWPWFGKLRMSGGALGYLASYPSMSPFHYEGNSEVWPANPFGIYQMEQEWVQDRYGAMSATAETDPTGPSVLGSLGFHRVLKSGGTVRRSRSPGDREGGFRLVCVIDDHFQVPPQPVASVPPPERAVRALEPLRIDLGAGIALDLLKVPACTFAMGRPKPEIGWGTKEWLQTPVTIPRAYWLGRCEVTQAQFRALTGLSPSHFPGDDHPVESVGYDDTQRFFIALNRRERDAGRLPVDEEYRLPTEAEWECAYRAGTDTLYPFGDDPAHLPFYDVVDTPDGTRPVASKRPNPWGLYDMGGNVLELTADIFGPYPGKPVTDPFDRPWGSNYWGKYRGWLAGRGGSWSMGPYASRSTIRRGIPAASGCYFIGFRVARGQTVKPPEMDR